MTELLAVVDENDNPLRGEDRKVVHSSTLWHRGIHVFVFNPQGELLVQLRSPLKDKYPDTYDCSISGQVGYGEQYEETASREIVEELGIKGAKLIPALHFRMRYGPSDYHVCKLFECVYDGEIKPNEEVSEIKFLGMNDLRKLLVGRPEMFTPWFVELLKWYFKMENNLILLP
ncbi:MAG: NUDIX domain-containing protein [Candidatus Aenigmatarchaeota archaeon]